LVDGWQGRVFEAAAKLGKSRLSEDLVEVAEGTKCWISIGR
jgi:hypothetical protein